MALSSLDIQSYLLRFGVWGQGFVSEDGFIVFFVKTSVFYVFLFNGTILVLVIGGRDYITL